jgi:tetrahydromethanopterin S-methyltransferase subunit G
MGDLNTCVEHVVNEVSQKMTVHKNVGLLAKNVAIGVTLDTKQIVQYTTDLFSLITASVHEAASMVVDLRTEYDVLRKLGAVFAKQAGGTRWLFWLIIGLVLVMIVLQFAPGMLGGLIPHAAAKPP